MSDRVKNMEKEYEKKILRTTFGIGRQRRLNNPQLASRYSDAVLENWVPKQELMPVDIHGKPLTAAAISSNQRTPFYSNPEHQTCLLYTSPSPRDRQKSRMPSSA